MDGLEPTMKKLTTYSRDDLQIVSRKLQWQGYFRMIKYTFSHKLFKGGVSKPIERELFERGHAVVVIPYDPITDQVVLIEQIRVGAFDHQINPWMIELVAGIIDEGEDSQSVAIRETFEETGLECQQCKKIMSYLSSPGGMSERIDMYIARVDVTKISQYAGLEAEGEDIRVFVMNRTDALKALESGEIKNGASIIGLQWLALNVDKLNQQWLS
ncbi:MAG: ADP-ribose diphosphatase [Gammaproteobacteria bacterium]|nr:ADP-ribose diphosphatase [Gammaproteobacteria bacterium]